MNVFVLSTGRCGSTTFARACGHLTNYTSAHESRAAMIGSDRLAYPDNHIEADNRLSWMLGRLDEGFGNNAIYIHLTRNDTLTAKSFVKRYDYGIIRAYRTGIVFGGKADYSHLDLCVDYMNTVNKNIEFFLKNKTKAMTFRLDNAEEDFEKFLRLIDAQGDLDAARREFKVRHNASGGLQANAPSLWSRALNKLWRIVKKLPAFVKSA